MFEVRNALRWIPTRVLIGTSGLAIAMLFVSGPCILTWLITAIR